VGTPPPLSHNKGLTGGQRSAGDLTPSSSIVGVIGIPRCAQIALSLTIGSRCRLGQGEDGCCKEQRVGKVVDPFHLDRGAWIE
jgi:hypothetical protein